MTESSYKQFCPVAMAAEVLCGRWTIVLLRELVAGSTRFNDLRRGVPSEDISLQMNYEIHQRLVDEKHEPFPDWEITMLLGEPERVRAVGAVYWEGRVVGAPEGALIKCVVGEDWIVQRTPSGELKIALYINTYHYFLPGSARMNLK